MQIKSENFNFIHTLNYSARSQQQNISVATLFHRSIVSLEGTVGSIATLFVSIVNVSVDWSSAVGRVRSAAEFFVFSGAFAVQANTKLVNKSCKKKYENKFLTTKYPSFLYRSQS